MRNIGWGLPPIDYITQRGPFQHGVSVRDLRLQPRMIQLLIDQNFCSRDDYWAGRGALLDQIRPNRPVPFGIEPGQLRRVLSDGSIRDLDVFIQQGPQFGREIDQWKEWGFSEVLRFVAFNPVVYDPALKTQSNWTIPNGAVNDTQGIDYLGTWEEYPTLIITGPLNNPRIESTTAGNLVIELTYNIPAAGPGNIVTITLTYGQKTVVDEAGTNLIGTVTTASDLACFHLVPQLANVNGINLQGSAAVAGVTDFEVQWRNRYIGI